jgi:hypothetical protein
MTSLDFTLTLDIVRKTSCVMKWSREIHATPHAQRNLLYGLPQNAAGTVYIEIVTITAVAVLFLAGGSWGTLWLTSGAKAAGNGGLSANNDV